MSTQPSRRSTRGAAQPDPTTPVAASPEDSGNKLREALEEGVLTIKKNYQDFGVFLDIKKELRSEFLTSLWNHVLHNQYEWETLASDHLERRECATSFITKVGMKYWGTEENRRRCLMPDSLDSPEYLFTYPERKRELIQVVMILLEKKAKSEVNGTQDPKNARKRPLRAATPGNGSSPLSESSRQKRKRRRGAGRRSGGVRLSPDLESSVFDSDVEMNDSKPTVEVVITSPHTPSKSPKKGDFTRCTSSPTRKRANGSKKKEDKNKNKTRTPSSDFDIDDIATGEKLVDYSKSLLRNSMSRDIDFARLEERLGPKTRYLVEATSQEGMAPVLVPFRPFDTVASFLETMEAETHLQEWNPSAQLGVELRRQTCPDFSPMNVDAPTTSYYRIFAASVRFEWSNFHIRVRPGHDNDLREVMDELHRSWLREEEEEVDEPNHNNMNSEGVVEANGGDNTVDRVDRDVIFFNIHVMLHVTLL
ncbi:hypothetical protein VTN77DRAFT_4162 [Rasamsonia byssochlamydoides]|uniref:uncharacterized protein n=1 Tax=Rasamsonia byssochlamydoides TaxID=89139 RepID=UPI00374455DA